MNQPLREDGPFGIETEMRMKQEWRSGAFHAAEVRVIYADNNQPSHSVWMVPGSEMEA